VLEQLEFENAWRRASRASTKQSPSVVFVEAPLSRLVMKLLILSTLECRRRLSSVRFHARQLASRKFIVMENHQQQQQVL
jgi:hypothetical protein